MHNDSLLLLLLRTRDLSVLYMCKVERQIWNLQRKNRCLFVERDENDHVVVGNVSFGK